MKMNKEHAGRLGIFCAALAERGLTGAVLDRRDDCFYLSGYTGSDAVLVLSAKAGGFAKGWIVTDSRFTGEAEKSAPGFEVLGWRDGLAVSVGRLLRKERLRKAGYTPRSMTVAFFDAMRAEAGVTAWEDADPFLSGQRAVKSKREVAAIRRALDCAERAFLAARKRWKTGMTEIEVKNDLEWEMKRLGADNPAFETIVAVGANASFPHAHAGKGRIRPGKMLLVDFGAQIDRYCSDLTRTLWADEIPAAWAKRYAAVLEAQAAGLAAVRAGAGTDAPHRAAAGVFMKAGMAEKFTHSLGHGVGLAVHESPRLSVFRPQALAAGQIVTCEPGVYFSGSGGIRVEDMVLVAEEGAEVLSSLPKRLEDAIF